MTGRFFIAINLPPETQKKLEEKKQEIARLFPLNAVKWTKEENLHITLAFLGSVSTKNIETLIEDLESVKEKTFLLSLNEVCYFPYNKRKAKMIWAKGERAKIKSLHKKIEKALLYSSALNYNPEKRDFTTHITLGRIRSWQWRRLSLFQIPVLEENISLKFPVENFSLMESKLSKKGPSYKKIKEFKLLD